MPRVETIHRLGVALRQFGLVLAVPGALAAAGAEYVSGTFGVSPFWPALVAGAGLVCVGVGTLAYPEQLLSESDDVEFEHYAVESRGKAETIGRTMVVLGCLGLVLGVVV